MGAHRPIPNTVPVPQRRRLPYFGHALSLPRGADAMLHLMKESRTLGPVFNLSVFGNDMILVSDPDIVAELSNTDRFVKCIPSDLLRLRDLGGDGLFTAFNEEPNWQLAHDILMPAFSLDAMRGYHSTMVAAARSLLASWDRHAIAQYSTDVPTDMTRLTFDTIGMCGFGYDFASFDRPEPHPFIASMMRALNHAQATNELPDIVNRFTKRKNAQYAADIRLMTDLIKDIVEQRRVDDPTRTDDLLGRMLNSVDPRTGTMLDDDNVRNQVMTFLIAGHETTGGALSFALYYLAKNPAVLSRAQQEVDLLWGTGDDIDPTYSDVGKLTYVRQILNEALRLWPTAPGYAVQPLEDTVVGGKYALHTDEAMTILTPALHRVPAWGDNVDSFDPERFSPEQVARRPVHVYKPFGNGERACIGRQFALHEATLVLGMLIHRFRLDDRTNYQLKIGMTLTIKPEGFTLVPIRRQASDRHRPAAAPATAPVAEIEPQITRPQLDHYRTLVVAHGSNLGTSSRIASELTTTATELGMDVTLHPLDEIVDALDPGTLLVVVASSYNGRPTDDATQFVQWVQGLDDRALDGVGFAVLGVGDSNWAATYQHIPTLVDARLAAAGATRVHPRGQADVAGEFTGTVERWVGALWDTIGTTATAAPSDDAELALEDALGQTPPAHSPRHVRLDTMTVLDCTELVDMDHHLGRSKKHIRLALPEGTTYRTADHIAILPRNLDANVERVAKRFTVELDNPVRLTGRGGGAHLPRNRVTSLREILKDTVELQDSASLATITTLADACSCPPEKAALRALAGLDAEEFDNQVVRTGTSALDLLERFESIDLPLEVFLGLLPELRPRRYSISSSPSVSPGVVDLMVSALDAPHRAPERGSNYRGTASNWLSSLRASETIAARVIPCSDGFRLTADAPAIVVSAGTGLAPFRGVIQDRLAARSAAPLLAYFGCDHPEVDYLHREELEKAEAEGVVSMRPTFAMDPVDGQRFVQDRMIAEGAEILAMVDAGCQIRVCGDGSRVGVGVDLALTQIFSDHAGLDTHRARERVELLRADGRYVSDVWTQ
ncbi:cytochrome P450 [Rhodococcus sovatensis]|uniref:Bifunctional cytochrome P450/NADPH--P450 reductase n=1 Tax=Rhodococcus sovatensis TaxID=1805840 RepID=A0ABZ2PI55_9NOCA